MLLSLALALLSESRAAEVQFEGFYRSRFRGFDTLTLDRDNPLNEGLSAYVQHRLWLMPKFLLSDNVRLIVELRALDGVVWGDEPAAYDPYLIAPNNLFEYDLQSPTSSTDETAPLLDLTLWRAYGEVNTPIGQFTFGRVPLHWGMGLWLNDGRSVNPDFADHGDTTDRLMWESLIQNQFYLRANVDVPAERLIGENDDTTAFGLGVAYKTEDITAGLLMQLDHSGSRQGSGSLNVFTADAAGDVTLGPLNLKAEAVGQFGGGDLEGGINDATITSIGAALDATLDLDRIKPGLQGGVATGDGDLGNQAYKTFTFDRDYSVGMFLFEQPMPMLSTPAAAGNDTNQGRDYSEVLTGNALANALFLKPRLSFRVIDDLWLDGSWLTARTARAPKVNNTNQSRSYGNEFQIGARYEAIPHFHAGGSVGMFLPGTVYSVGDISASANGNTSPQTGFSEPAFGFQLLGRIEF